MNIVTDLWQKATGGSAIALGYFDGVHLGHRAVISRMMEAAKAGGLTGRVLTYAADGAVPQGKDPQLLQTEEQKAAVMAELGVEEIIRPDFAQMRDLAPEEFVSRVLMECWQAKVVVCGFNYRFGKNAAGDVPLLQKLCEPCGVQVIPLEPVEWEGQVVSSTRIRGCIAAGQMAEAAAMLGRPFGIMAEVVYGRRLGRTIEAPTINQEIPPGFAIPRYGVYYSRVQIDGKTYHGVTNVGVKPTLDPPQLRCETHILDFEGDLYGRVPEVQLLQFIRDEVAFPTVEDLARQIQKDILTVKSIAKET